ncbi:MAG: arsenosugar biosynthesis radical SAM protein ArsS [Desulfocapsaceae bacterium]|nr:arsenosugar biosynthesis radical SAM protein ArsS [Desulfocapsaceae bacterium]
MVKPFAKTLAEHQLHLQRGTTTTLQINVGRRCNLACRHCHVDAGAGRTEVMDRKTMNDIIHFAKQNDFQTADITGGAPELVPGIDFLLRELRPLVARLILRTNLVLLLQEEYAPLLELCKALEVEITASFPSTNAGQTDSQRGKGVWQDSIAMLKRLNAMGYGMPESPLVLNLVANPSGAFMPVAQCQAEKKIKTDLARRWNITFTHLFTFANVPLGRFRRWLESSGNFTQYMDRLAGGFNPSTIDGLMCRTLISVSWDGFLYDCDFNQAADLPSTGDKVHISAISSLSAGTSIITDDHCYACTAGSGFT